MPRDVHALDIAQWGSAGQAADFVDPPAALVASGFTSDYSPPGMKNLEREYLNTLLRRLTTVGVELNEIGLLEWAATSNYRARAIVNQAGDIFRSLVITGPATANAAQPGTNVAIWEQLTRRLATPGQITNPTLTPGNAELAAEWVCPSDGGAVVDRFRVRIKLTSEAAWTAAHVTELADANTRHVFSNLVNGQSYDVQVSAHNAAGWGTWSGTTAGSPTAQAPSTPANLQGRESDQSAILRWLASIRNGGTNVVTYRIVVRRSTDPVGTVWRTHTTTELTFTVPNLVNGQTYYFCIRAQDNGGNSMHSPEIAVTPAPRFMRFTADANFAMPWSTTRVRAVLCSGKSGTGGTGGRGIPGHAFGSPGGGGTGGPGEDGGNGATSGMDDHGGGGGEQGGPATASSITVNGVTYETGAPEGGPGGHGQSARGSANAGRGGGGADELARESGHTGTKDMIARSISNLDIGDVFVVVVGLLGVGGHGGRSASAINPEISYPNGDDGAAGDDGWIEIYPLY